MSPLVLLIVSLVLWFAPLWLWRAKGARLGNFDQRGWPRGRHAVLTFLDTARALAGGALLARALTELPFWPLPYGWVPEAWLALAFLAALSIHAFSWSNEDYLLCPVAFVIGGLAALLHPAVLGLSLLLATGTAVALRAWTGFFLGAGLGVIGVGFVIEQQDWRRSLMLGVVFFAVILLAPLSGRHFGGLRR